MVVEQQFPGPALEPHTIAAGCEHVLSSRRKNVIQQEGETE
jgi:hypothetical protein